MFLVLFRCGLFGGCGDHVCFRTLQVVLKFGDLEHANQLSRLHMVPNVYQYVPYISGFFGHHINFVKGAAVRRLG